MYPGPKLVNTLRFHKIHLLGLSYEEASNSVDVLPFEHKLLPCIATPVSRGVVGLNYQSGLQVTSR
jgi:hypothetical protein